MKEEQIAQVREQYGRTVSSGDLAGIAACSAVPALVLGERLAAVEVRWSARDAAGVERSGERSYYILRLGDDGRPHIRVAISRPE